MDNDWDDDELTDDSYDGDDENNGDNTNDDYSEDENNDISNDDNGNDESEMIDDGGSNLKVTFNLSNNNNDSRSGQEEINEDSPDTMDSHFKSETTTTNNDIVYTIRNNQSGETTGVDSLMVQAHEDVPMIENPGVTGHMVMQMRTQE